MDNRELIEYGRNYKSDELDPVIFNIPGLPSLFQNAFNFSGRTGVQQFRINLRVAAVTLLLTVGYLTFFADPEGVAMTLGKGIILLTVIAVLSSNVRRTRDIGLHATDSFFFLFPIAGLFDFEKFYYRPSNSKNNRDAEIAAKLDKDE